MEKIDRILASGIKTKGLKKTLDCSLICFYATEWGKGRFRTISFLNGSLKVFVSSSPAASELKMQQQELIDFINDKTKRRAVRSVRIVVNKESRIQNSEFSK